MKRSLSKAFLILIGAVLCSQGDISFAQVVKHPGLKEIEMLKVRDTGKRDLPSKFNHDRPFAISVNSGIPDAPAIMEELISLLADKRMLKKIVFERFGPEKTENIEVKIGKRVPVEITQTTIRVLSRRENLSIIVSLFNDDELFVNNRRVNFGYTQRIMIGVLIKSKNMPLSKETMSSLLKDGITQKEFLNLLSEAK